MPAKIRWTDDAIETVIRRTEAGVPAREIAADLGINRSTLQYKINVLRAAGRITGGGGESHIWTDDDVDAVVRMTQQGMTAPEIADELGRSAPSVNSKLTKLRKAGVLPWAGKGTGHKNRADREPDAEMRALLRRFTAACKAIKEATNYGGR